MGRRPASSTAAAAAAADSGLRKGAWTVEEDIKLMAYVTKYGCWNWRQLPKFAGLARCGKSCRLRWLNYLKPDIKRGNYTKEEEDTIIRLHESVGNKWSLIAAQLPGRTDNEIKNHWHGKLKKMLKRAPSLKDRCKATSSSLTSEVSSTCIDMSTYEGFTQYLEAGNTPTEDSVSCCLQGQQKQSSLSCASSSSDNIHSDISGDLWKDPFVADGTYINYVGPDDFYLHYVESFVAAADIGYDGLLSFPWPSDVPTAGEDEFLLPLWPA